MDGIDAHNDAAAFDQDSTRQAALAARQMQFGKHGRQVRKVIVLRKELDLLAQRRVQVAQGFRLDGRWNAVVRLRERAGDAGQRVGVATQ